VSRLRYANPDSHNFPTFAALIAIIEENIYAYTGICRRTAATG
jgi:hypothetical protein